MGSRTIVLLRHGHYDAEDGGHLTNIGREQARLAGKYLEGIRFHAIWSSTLPRARETSDIVAQPIVLECRYSGLLREGIYTKVEGYNIPPSERLEDRERADAAYRKFFRKSRTDRTELLVCHGNLIRYFVCRALHVPVQKWLRMTTSHCGISRVVIRDTGAVRVMSYNETAHLPPKLVT